MAKNDHVAQSTAAKPREREQRPSWACWGLSSFSAEGVEKQGPMISGRTVCCPGMLCIVSLWTACCALRGRSLLSLYQCSRTPVSELPANLPATSGLHWGRAGPQKKWGSLHNTGNFNCGPPLSTLGPCDLRCRGAEGKFLRETPRGSFSGLRCLKSFR